MTDLRIDPSTVPGWGVDADPRNDPTYPMRDRSGEPVPRGEWEHPAAQDTDIEVLRSNEFTIKPAVFGTSAPPSGISGMIRRRAFRFSENDWWHWLLLMGADRVNVVEGLLGDLARGKIPNIPGEMGARAEWKHNRTGFVLKSLATVAVGAAAFTLLSRRRPSENAH